MDYTIGQFSQKTGISIQALRYYDREGVLKPERVTVSGNRIYSNNSIKHANVVQQAKENGFSLKEIAAVMVAMTKSKSCSSIFTIVNKRLFDIQQQKKRLIKSERFLKKLSLSCSEYGAGENCIEVKEF